MSNYRRRIGTYAIIDLLEALIGNIKPVGDTNTDKEVKRNVEDWAYVAQVMVDKLADVANIDSNGLASVDRVKHLAETEVAAISDGYHNFADLYEQRLVLSAALANNTPTAWKSKLHEDGTEPFGGGWFVVGWTTPEGEYTYHYEMKDWDLFKCYERPRAKTWDGHTSKDVRRLLSLEHGGTL